VIGENHFISIVTSVFTDEGGKMQPGNIFMSLDIIEDTIRRGFIPDVKTCNHIIFEEIKKIRECTDDMYVNEMIFSVYHNWKVYSGQKSSEGFISKRYQELEYMFTDCAHIRNYVSRFLEVKIVV
jgi:hypothetical protein